jgi:hypothetical protein
MGIVCNYKPQSSLASGIFNSVRENEQGSPHPAGRSLVLLPNRGKGSEIYQNIMIRPHKKDEKCHI